MPGADHPRRERAERPHLAAASIALPELHAQIEKVRALHDEDLKVGYAGCSWTVNWSESIRRQKGAHLAMVLPSAHADLRAFIGRE